MLHGYSRHFGVPRGLWCEGCEDEDGNSIWLYWDEYAMGVDHVRAEVNGSVSTICDSLDFAKVEAFLLLRAQEKELDQSLIGSYLVPTDAVSSESQMHEDPQSQSALPMNLIGNSPRGDQRDGRRPLHPEHL